MFPKGTEMAWNGLMVWHKTFLDYPFKRQPDEMVKHTQTIRRLLADELFECVRPLWRVGPEMVEW